MTGYDGLRWWPGIVRKPVISYRLFDGAFTGQGSTGRAALVINADTAIKARDDAPLLKWAGAPVLIHAIRTGETATLVFSGVVDRYEFRDGAISIEASVDSRRFDTPALSAFYLGTGGAEGTADLKNRPKPWALGAPRNVEPVLIDPINSVFQVSAYGPIDGFDAVYERAASFGSPVGDFASYPALVAATIPPGRWGSCIALGMFRLGAPPAGVVTCDVRGDHPTSGIWARLPGDVLQRILTHHGLWASAADHASVSALNTAVPRNISIYIDSQVGLMPLIESVAASLNAVALVDGTGKLVVPRVVVGTSPAVTLELPGRRRPLAVSSVERDVGPPFWRIEMLAERAWRVHNADEIAFYAEIIDRGEWQAGETYREGHIASRGGARWLYINPTPTAGNVPPTWPTASNAFWTVHTPPVGWSTILDDDGNKPEDNATFGAPQGTAVGGIPVEVGYALTPTGMMDGWQHYGSIAALQRAWDVSHPSTLSLLSDSNMSGGVALQVTGTCTLIGNHRIAYAHEDLYRVRTRFFVSSLGSGNEHYVGITAFDAAGTQLTSTDGGLYHYFAGAGGVPSTGFYEWEGYFRGRAAAGVGANVGVTSPNPSAPNPVLNNAVTIAPVFIANLSGSGGVIRIDYIEIEKVEDLTPLPSRPWTSTDSQIRGQVVTWEGRSWIALVDNVNVQPPSTPASTATWALLADKGQDGADGADGTDGLTGGGQAAFDVACTAAGVVKAGELPQARQLRLFRGDTELTTAASWSVSGVTGGTIAVGASTGVVTLSAITADVASATATATVGAQSLSFPVSARKVRDGAAAVGAFFTIDFPSLATAAQLGISAEIALPADMALALDMNAYWDSSSGAVTCEFWFQVRVNGGAWSTVGAAESASATPGEPAALFLSRTFAAASSARIVEVRVMGTNSNFANTIDATAGPASANAVPA